MGGGKGVNGEGVDDMTGRLAVVVVDKLNGLLPLEAAVIGDAPNLDGLGGWNDPELLRPVNGGGEKAAEVREAGLVFA
jgi:hypothetical protein